MVQKMGTRAFGIGFGIGIGGALLVLVVVLIGFRMFSGSTPEPRAQSEAAESDSEEDIEVQKSAFSNGLAPNYWSITPKEVVGNGGYCNPDDYEFLEPLLFEDRLSTHVALGCSSYAWGSFDVNTAESTWTDIGNRLSCTQSLDGQTMLCAAADATGFYSAVDANTGKEIGSQKTGHIYAATAIEDGWISLTAPGENMGTGMQLTRFDSEAGKVWQSSNIELLLGHSLAIEVVDGFALVQDLEVQKSFAVVDIDSGDVLVNADGGLAHLGVDGNLFFADPNVDVNVPSPLKAHFGVSAFNVQTSTGVLTLTTDVDFQGATGLFDPTTGGHAWEIPVGDYFPRPQALIGPDNVERLVWGVPNIMGFASIGPDGEDFYTRDVEGFFVGVAGDTVVTAHGEDEMVHGWDPATGELAWEVPGMVLAAANDDSIVIDHSFPYKNPNKEYEKKLTIYHAAKPGEGIVNPGGKVTGGSVMVAADLPGGVSCPPDTIMLAFGQTNEGWVLVCGYRPEEPTYMLVASNSARKSGDVGWVAAASGKSWFSETETSNVTWSGGIYEGRFSGGGQIAFSDYPGTLTEKDAKGNSLSQDFVTKFCLVNMEAGQSTCNENSNETGAYGADLPEDTDEDQVRYLSEIIERSKEARLELGPAVNRISEGASGTTLSDDIEIIRGVRDNREELINALASAPVDKVPDGTILVNELTAALKASYNADVGYLDWAEAIRSNGGKAPSPTVGDQYSYEAGRLKDIFSEHWNKTIAEKYKVPTVSRETL